MTCFTDAGMTYYRQPVDAVYHASKTHRGMGWDGKLLVHTHVGEGFAVYYDQHQPPKPWTFDSVFSELPVLDDNVVSNAQAPRDNITQLLDAVEQVRADYPDLDRYVAIRFGPLTHATLDQAKRMADLRIEADVNFNSNIATGAWSLAQMPEGRTLADEAAAIAGRPERQLRAQQPAGVFDPRSAQRRTSRRRIRHTSVEIPAHGACSGHAGLRWRRG